MATIETITLGALQLTAEFVPPLVKLRADNDPYSPGFYITASEYQSLTALSDVIRQQALLLVRHRDALREALEMVRVGHTDERLQILQDFLEGKRDGL